MTGRARGHIAGILLAGALVGCADGPRERFARVVPMLERRCATAACHGVAPDDTMPPLDGFFVRLDAHGRIADVDAARAVTLERVSTRAPRASSLVRIPSPRWMGGGPHAGGALFVGPDDPELEALLDWIRLEERGGEDLDLSSLERQFGDDVLPVLTSRCARDGCHGPLDVVFTAFPVHVVPGEGLTDVDVRATHRVARKLLDLVSADPANARLIRKAIGELAGGLVHRGDASTFFPEAPTDDPLAAPGLSAMLEWARAERAALGVHDGRAPSAVLYVEGPPGDRAPYRIELGPTGSDLMRAGWPSPGEPENLTADLHPEGPAEVRDPALSHDARRVTFAMRRAHEDRFALYELQLVTRQWRRVTPADAPGSFVQPTYLPDGRVAAAWDGHGELAADGDGVAPELVAIDAGGQLERLTYTPAPEVAPSVLASGKTRGMLVFGTRRAGDRGPEGVLFRFPLCHDPTLHGEPEYHVQFGASVAPFAPLAARDLPDGRQLVVTLPSTDASDDRGLLAVLDRSLGVHLEDAAVASVGGYRGPWAWLDRTARWRDVAPLPDGGFVGAIDEGEGALVVARVGPEGLVIEPWLARPGRSLRSPVPVIARPAEDDAHEPITDPRLDTGFLVLRDVAVLESLYGRAEPRGVRGLRDDIVGLRVIASMQVSARDVRRYEDGTTVGLTTQVPARVLAELALPADRSAWLEVPARTPVRLALIDAEGMEVGRGLDRWYYAEGAETVPGGTNAPTYAHACAGCHGAASGDPRDAATVAPDAISAASVTLSTHHGRDRRRPRAPLAMLESERVDFVTTIAPALDACTGCHAGASAAGGLALDPAPGERFPRAYEALLARVDRVTLRARRSPLVERLVGRELEAEGEVRGVCPPSGPDAALVRRLARWIEVGAFYDLDAREARDAP